MWQVGVTGGIGSGKSVVCRILEVMGIPVFAADQVAKDLLDGTLRHQVIARFGPAIYASGRLDRHALADRVFTDPSALKDLNAMVHPAVRARFREWANEQRSAYVVMEAAILVETGAAEQLDHLVVVEAPMELRIRRVMERDGVARSAVLARMASQFSDQERRAAAGKVIVNDEKRLLLPQVLELHQAMLKAAGHA
ncbi:MAG: dephospho-CoA kinase [Flavobacteriales bacterium]|nr:dephospho-CoA kinase [Flavobacteriales bacterium]